MTYWTIVIILDINHVRIVYNSRVYRGRLVSDTLDNDSRGYSSTPPSSPGQSHSPNIRESRGSCKQLMREEERDPFRWGHAGFKELYPDEFASSDDEERSGEGENEKRKARKGHSRKRKREHKDKRKTKRRKLKSGEEKSEASSKKKQQKAKKRKQRRAREQESSTSDSSDESYNDSSSGSELEEQISKREKKRTSRHKRK